jgi:DNA topoisomerase II
MALRQLQPSSVDGNRKTIEQTYQKLSQIEHILLRPDTYIGSAERITTALPVWDGLSGRMVTREVTYPPGLYKIFDEILVNAADHRQRCATMTSIRVDIEPENNKISIWNDGTGIPIEIHEKEGVYVPELIFGHLLTSSNYDDNEKKVVGGRNGYGAKLANIFSTEFVVETADQESGKQYSQTFRQNMSSKSKPVITSSGKKAASWTRITFFPDLQKFGMVCLDDDIVALMKKRVYDVAGSNAGLRVFLNGEKLPIKSFKDYMALYYEEKPEIPFIHEKSGDRWEVAVGASQGQLDQVSFVNSIWTIKGGSHVMHVVDQIVAKIVDYVVKKKKGMKLKPHQVKPHLNIFVNCLVENPAFNSQTKETLTSTPSQFGSKFVLSDDMTKKIMKSGIVENVLEFAKFQQRKELTKTDGGKIVRVIGIPKLDDANKAGGREASKCTLILTEGDSAKALAISGLSVIGRDYYGVFPLRGKLLNVREASHKQIMENAEICNLKKILGLQQGKTYNPETLKTLRYGHVLIMTDQDHDGSHIKGLLINFFGHFWPSLLMIDGFLQEFITPIVKCIKGKSEKVFFTMPEYYRWMEGLDETDSGSGASKRVGWKPKYYKGLGTSTAAEAKTYFSNLCQHLLSFCWRGENDATMIELAFAKAKVSDRKDWLTNFVPGTYFDHAVDELNYSNFVNKELILFSIADNARSIPNVIDGLKPSQRKVLFACFKRKLIKNEIKVVQLAGYVSEHAAYHHGEASLQATIVGLAQNFVGSNNANLLVPAGQFGTRLQGGKDAASSRYIFTKLAPVARALFPEEDDALLKYLEDDGLSIEPEWYCPIIPTVLVNGAEGIGTGWSSQVPCYNPKDLIENVRRMLKKEKPLALIPWYRGFEGSIVPVEASVSGTVPIEEVTVGPSLSEPSSRSIKSFDVHGIVIRGDSDNEIKVRELPIRSWITPYKEFLESNAVGNSSGPSVAASTKKELAKLPIIKEFADQSTENKVSFNLSLTEAGMQEILSTGAHKLLKLSGSVTTSNMMLFDPAGRIVKYDDTTAIFNEFFAVRHAMYERRRSHILKTLQDELDSLDNKQRFILLIIDGKFVVAKRKKAAIIADLRKHGFKAIPRTPRRSSVISDEEKADSDTGGAGNEPQSSSLAKTIGDQDYDYLLSMPLWSLTMERVEKLCLERNEKAVEKAQMEKTTVADLWIRDLTRLESVLAEDEAHALADAMDLEKAARSARNDRIRANGRGKSKSKKEAAKQVQQDGEDDLHDNPNIIPPPTARVIRVRQPQKARTQRVTGAAGSTKQEDNEDEDDEVEAGLKLQHPARSKRAAPARLHDEQDASVREALENDGVSFSSSDDELSMSLAERIAERGRSTANQKRVPTAKSNSLHSTDDSATAKETSLVKRARATKENTPIGAQDEEPSVLSPSVMQKKKKSRIISPRATKTSLPAKRAAVGKKKNPKSYQNSLSDSDNDVEFVQQSRVEPSKNAPTKGNVVSTGQKPAQAKIPEPEVTVSLRPRRARVTRVIVDVSDDDEDNSDSNASSDFVDADDDADDSDFE